MWDADLEVVDRWGTCPGPVLVPLDGSPLAERALPWAASLAARRRAPLLLERVVRPWIAPVAPGSAEMEAEHAVVEADRVAATQYLEAQAGALRDAVPGLNVRMAVRLGEPASALVELELEQDAQAVVMTTHGRSGLERWLRGSVAEAVLRRGTAPVLLIRPGDEPARAPSIGRNGVRVLVALDGSPLAEAAVPEACRVAAPANGVVLLATVLDPAPPPGSTSSAGSPAGASTAGFSERTAAWLHLDTVACRLRRRGVRDRMIVLTARDPAAALVELATVEEVDVVVMGTHGRGGLGRWRYGSVADAVARTAPTPVLLVRPRAVG
ncbi:MAG: universal stress protein, partial [Chloroflexota bacterium]